MSEGQPLRVLVVGVGVFKSQVIKNTSQFLTIARPVNSKNTTTMAWSGLSISVYFWREDDAGYVFDSEVLDEVFSLGIPSIKITHGDSLFRTQKRKSIRVKMQKAAFLYLVPSHESPHRLASEPGLKCLLEDISDTGCAVTVGGRADAGLRVKVQFALNNAAVCMTGTVRSIRYNESTDRSMLHIEAEPLSVETRNRVLGEVFGMQPEEDENELPFRVLDDEIADLEEEGPPADASSADVPVDGESPDGGLVEETVTLDANDI
jgi:c-di-GMP-binding flagellar brake protein YcgR